MTNVKQTLKQLHTLKSDMNDILNLVGGDGENIVIDESDLDEKFLFGQLQDIINLVDDLNFKLSYLSKEITVQGFLQMNKEGFYEFASGEYLRRGSPIELLVAADEGQEWIYTHVAYSDGEYYAMFLGQEHPLKETLVRIRG